jgi:hypothetical protein
MRSLTWTWAAALAAALAPPLQAEEYERQMQAGAAAAAQGDWAAAAPAYKAAAAASRTYGDRGRATLEYALALRAQHHLEAMVVAYRELLELAELAPREMRKEREVACNNLGVYYSQRGKLPEALAVFRKVARPSNPDAFVYYYNFARTLEKQAERDKAPPKEAYTAYWNSLRKQPGYAKASDAIVRLLLAEPVRRPGEVRLLVQALTGAEPRQVSLAGKQLLAVLRAWGDSDPDGDLLAALLRYLAAAGPSPPSYRDDYRPPLQGLNRAVTDAALKNLDLLFTDAALARPADGAAPRLFRSPAEAQALLPGWGDLLQRDGGAARDVSRLLTRAADWYARQAAGKAAEPAASARAAVARYTAAFMLDPTNLTAALNAAGTLDEHAGRLDPTGAVLKRYINTLYDGKTDLLRQALARKKPDKDDWLKLYSFRVVLAELYARKNVWGTPGDFHSAIGQLTLAEEAERVLQDLDPRYPSSPLLPQALGEAHRAKGNRSDAAVAFGRAAEGFIQTGNPKRASQMLAAAAELAPDERLKGHLATLQRLSQVAVKTVPVEAELPLTAFEDDTHALATLTPEGIQTYDRTTGRLRPGPTRWDPDDEPFELPVLAHAQGAGAFKSGDEVYFCSNRTGLQKLPIDARPVEGLGMSADGKLLALAEADGAIRLWDTGRRAEYRRLAWWVGRVETLSFAPDGDRLALASGRRITVWASDAGERLAEFRIEPAGGADAAVTALAFGPRGRLLAAGSSDGMLRLWSVADRKLLHQVRAGRVAVTALVFAHDGRLLVSGDEAGGLWLWSPGDGQRLGPLPSARGRLTSLALSRDGRSLAAGIRKPDERSELQVLELPVLKLPALP